MHTYLVILAAVATLASCVTPWWMSAAQYAQVLERYLSATEEQLAECLSAVWDSGQALATCQAAEQQIEPSLRAARSAVAPYRNAPAALRRYHEAWLEVMRRLASSAADSGGDLQMSRLEAHFKRLENLASALRPNPDYGRLLRS